jgi:DNA-binding response OmpR family regulator
LGDTTDILVIDDNQHQLNFLMRLLQFYGYNTQTLNKSKNAIKEIIKINPKLIVLDIMMPDLDGYTLLKKIRDHQKLGSIPVIIFTSKFYNVDRKKAFGLGANAFITKPAKGAVIMTEIKKYL